MRSGRFAPLPVIVALVVASCGGNGDHQSPAGSGAAASSGAPASPTPVPSPVPLTVGLGYIPSVQFAPFYRAVQAGYYADEGLNVTFQNKIDPDLVALVGANSLDIGIADGTSVIPAVSQGIPVRYISTVYGQFPSIVFGKASTGISTAAGLKGRKIGIPGRYGSSWIMLQALLGSAKLSVNDVHIVEYPDFGQGAAVAQGAVDAATGFVNNEPVQLELSGVNPFILRVDDITPLPGPGLITSTKTLATKHDAVAGFVRATLKAMDEIASDPRIGLEAAISAVPELGQTREAQSAILEATLEAWHDRAGSPDNFGRIDRTAWQQSIDFMASLGLVPNPVKLDDVIVDEFVKVP
jgi:NitT/TauT family transport system substrate-binding protein